MRSERIQTRRRSAAGLCVLVSGDGAREPLALGHDDAHFTMRQARREEEGGLGAPLFMPVQN